MLILLNIIKIFLLISYSYSQAPVNIEKSEAPILSIGPEYIFNIHRTDVKPFSIVCSGKSKLTWHTNVFEDYYEITDLPPVPKYPYRSEFKIEVPFPDDTGLYKCSDDTGATTWSYVYIHNISTTIFAAPPGETPEQIYVEPNSVILIPCKVTHPNVEVDLYKDAQKFDRSEYNLKPREGVFITNNSMGIYGIYKCQNPDDEEDFNYFEVQHKRIQVQVGVPRIATFRNAHAIIGEPFQMNCSVPYQRDVRITWLQVPNNAIVHDPLPAEYNGFQNLVTRLYIKKPRLTNSGSYTCRASVLDEWKESKENITFKRSVEPYVQFISENETLFAPPGSQFLWSILFRGYPEGIWYQFYDPWGRIINSTSQMSTNFNYINGHLSLHKEVITVKDFGTYQAKIFTADNGSSAMISAFLISTGLPTVEIHEFSVTQVNHQVRFEATILSFDGNGYNLALEPNVTWWISTACEKELCIEEEKYQLNSTLKKCEVPEDRWISHVDHIAKLPGMVWCKVEDRRGTNEANTSFIVTDVDTVVKFAIQTENGEFHHDPVSSAKIIEGDTGIIVCKAVKFLYSELNLTNDGNFTAETCDSDLSLGQCINISNVQSNFTGQFACRLQEHGKKTPVEYHLNVVAIESMAPIVRDESNFTEAGSEITVRMGTGLNISCLIDAKPKPTITWYKDGELLDTNTERIYTTNNKSILHFGLAVPEDNGEYECDVQNRIATLSLTSSITVQGKGLGTLQIVLLAIVCSAVLILLIIIMYLRAKVRKEQKLKMELRKNTLFLFEHGNIVDLDPDCTTDEQAELLPYDHSYEIPRDKIKLGKILGSGAFGQVKLARLDDFDESGKKTMGAVKMCKDSTDPSQLRSLTVELKIMIHIGRHLNIVNLLGAHTANVAQGELWIIVEYCKYGNLLKVIRRYKERFYNQINEETDEISTDVPPEYHNSLSTTQSNASKYINLEALNTLTRKTSQMSQQASFSRVRKLTNASIGSPTKPAGSTRTYVGNPEYDSLNVTLDPEAQPQKRDSGMSMSCDPSPKGPVSRTTSVSSTTYTCDDTAYNTLNKHGIPMSPSSTCGGSIYGGTMKKDPSIPGVSAPFTTHSLINWSWQMACGMEYLASRKVLHSDLAARNLLLASNNVLKISDFGLSRDMYKKDVYCKKSDDLMPIKWMSVEAIQERLFSTQSDVWAYGITLWEMFTLGNSPYPGVPVDNEFVLQLEDGMRMSQPNYSNKEIYDVMLKCWDKYPKNRPTFTELKEYFGNLMEFDAMETYLRMNESHMERNMQYFEKNTDYLTMVGSPEIDRIKDVDVVGPSGHDFPSDNDLIGTETQAGYLEMGSVCKSPESEKSAIFSPRNVDENIFRFPEKDNDEVGLKVNNIFSEKVNENSKSTEDISVDYLNLPNTTIENQFYDRKDQDYDRKDQEYDRNGQEIADTNDTPDYMNTSSI